VNMRPHHLSAVICLLTFDVGNHFPVGLSRLEKLCFLLLYGGWELHGAQALRRMAYSSTLSLREKVLYIQHTGKNCFKV
jgi:hypothetical protein